MIPKVIHYCWFGRNPLPPLAIKCIESWRKFLPDYEIKEWNEDNFDVNIIPYTAEAYQAKKYAFVSDYARFWILYKYGGLYFDTDVEVIKPLDDIISKGPFMGCETDYKRGATALMVAPGLGLGTSPALGLYKEILMKYEAMHFAESDGTVTITTTVVGHVTSLLKNRGLEDKVGIQEVDGVFIYPKDFFCPIDITTNRLHKTDNTRTIHHYAASWKDITWGDKIKKILRLLIPENLLKLYNVIKNY